MDYDNPEDLSWGTVAEGVLSGFYKDIVEEKIDVAIGGVALSWSRMQVV